MVYKVIDKLAFDGDVAWTSAEHLDWQRHGNADLLKQGVEFFGFALGFCRGDSVEHWHDDSP